MDLRYPSQLIFLFQFIVHRLCFLHLPDNQLQSILCLFVEVCKISPKVSLQHQIIEPYRIILQLIIRQMQEAESVNDELKEKNQLAWVQAMNSIHKRAEEIVLHELVYGEGE